MKSAKCNCGKYYTGDFCETPVDICTIETCYDQSLCNSSALEGDTPCAPCPVGYTGDGRTCASKYIDYVYNISN